jgi:hypothetical protein
VLITTVPQRSILHCRLRSVPSTKGGNQGRVHSISIPHVGHVGCCAFPLCILAFLANPASTQAQNLRAVPAVPLILRNIAFHQESARPFFVAILPIRRTSFLELRHIHLGTHTALSELGAASCGLLVLPERPSLKLNPTNRFLHRTTRSPSASGHGLLHFPREETGFSPLFPPDLLRHSLLQLCSVHATETRTMVSRVLCALAWPAGHSAGKSRSW